MSLSSFVYKTNKVLAVILAITTPATCQQKLNEIMKVSSICSHLSNFKTTEPLDLQLQRNTQETVFTHHKVSYSPESI